MTEAGWYDDGTGQLRYWDGAGWTDHTSPLVQPPAEPGAGDALKADDAAVEAEAHEPSVAVSEQADASAPAGFIAEQWDHHRARFVAILGAVSVLLLVGAAATAVAVVGALQTEDEAQPEPPTVAVATTEAPEPPSIVTPEPSVTPSPEAPEREPYQVLATGVQARNVWAGEDYYVIADAMTGELTTYDLDGLVVESSGFEIPWCSSGLVASGTLEDGHLVSVTVMHHEAQGLTAENWDMVIQSRDPKTYGVQWSTVVVEAAPQMPECISLGSDNFDGHAHATVTADGRWLATASRWTVDLDTGAATYADVAGYAVGDLMGLYYCYAPNCFNNLEQFDLVRPATGELALTLDANFAYEMISDERTWKVTDDGSTLVVSSETDENTFVRALSLADGSIVWNREGRATWRYSDHHPFADFDESAGVAIVDLQVEDSAVRYVGVSLATGEQLYELPADNVCAMSPTLTAVVANGQSVLIDTKTGAQVSYSSTYSSCGSYVGAGLFVIDETLVRLLP